jgi:microtubule-associated protein-like 6
MVTLDDLAASRLTCHSFRYPCVEKGAMFQCYRGHSSHVTCVRFTNDHRFLVSLGGADKCVMQWRHEVEELESDSEDEGLGQRAGLEATDVAHVNERQVERTALQDAAKGEKTANELVELASNQRNGGDEFMAVKPWMGAIVPPSKAPKGNPQTSTDVDLQLSWVLGYRSEGQSRAT